MSTLSRASKRRALRAAIVTPTILSQCFGRGAGLPAGKEASRAWRYAGGAPPAPRQRCRRLGATVVFAVAARARSTTQQLLLGNPTPRCCQLYARYVHCPTLPARRKARCRGRCRYRLTTCPPGFNTPRPSAAGISASAACLCQSVPAAQAVERCHRQSHLPASYLNARSACSKREQNIASDRYAVRAS